MPTPAHHRLPVLGLPLIAAMLALAPVAPAQAEIAGLASLIRPKAPPSVTIILVDSSASVSPADRALHRASVRSIAAALKPGDRVLVASAGDPGRAEFRTALDLVVPRHAARLDQRDAIERSRDRLIRAAYAELARKPDGRQTRLVEAIAASAPAFGARPAP
ncbi:MAG: hypothetical protein ACK4Z0_05845, partial [Sphingomonadaceae bacterium]